MNGVEMTAELEFEAIQKALLWSGSALLVGALLGFGLGVSVTREFYRGREGAP
ncbi:MAG: hypothetical protein KC636_39115 [Myxococcales bacterium]|nr:hypothetical protein [Myxococcales bacterium]